MKNPVLGTNDKFSLVYDIISVASESAVSRDVLASSLNLSHSLVGDLISLTICEGLLKAGARNGDLRLTSQGFAFLQEFSGIRKFLG